jgi:hypothetical protein
MNPKVMLQSGELSLEEYRKIHCAGTRWPDEKSGQSNESDEDTKDKKSKKRTPKTKNRHLDDGVDLSTLPTEERLERLHEKFCGTYGDGEFGDFSEYGGCSFASGSGAAQQSTQQSAGGTASNKSIPEHGQFQVALAEGDRALLVELWQRPTDMGANSPSLDERLGLRRGSFTKIFGSSDRRVGSVELPLPKLRELAASVSEESSWGTVGADVSEGLSTHPVRGRSRSRRGGGGPGHDRSATGTFVFDPSQGLGVCFGPQMPVELCLNANTAASSPSKMVHTVVEGENAHLFGWHLDIAVAPLMRGASKQLGQESQDKMGSVAEHETDGAESSTSGKAGRSASVAEADEDNADPLWMKRTILISASDLSRKKKRGGSKGGGSGGGGEGEGEAGGGGGWLSWLVGGKKEKGGHQSHMAVGTKYARISPVPSQCTHVTVVGASGCSGVEGTEGSFGEEVSLSVEMRDMALRVEIFVVASAGLFAASDTLIGSVETEIPEPSPSSASPRPSSMNSDKGAESGGGSTCACGGMRLQFRGGAPTAVGRLDALSFAKSEKLRLQNAKPGTGQRGGGKRGGSIRERGASIRERGGSMKGEEGGGDEEGGEEGGEDNGDGEAAAAVAVAVAATPLETSSAIQADASTTASVSASVSASAMGVFANSWLGRALGGNDIAVQKRASANLQSAAVKVAEEAICAALQRLVTIVQPTENGANLRPVVAEAGGVADGAGIAPAPATLAPPVPQMKFPPTPPLAAMPPPPTYKAPAAPPQ